MPFTYMILSVLCWSLFPLMGILGITRLGVFDFILWTYAVSCAAAVIGYAMASRASPKSAKAAFKIDGGRRIEIFFGCLSAFLSFTCLLFSFYSFPRAGSVIIFEGWPIMALYLAPVLLHQGWEKISRRDVLFSALTLVGLGFLMLPPMPHLTLLQWSLPLLGGVLMAAASVMKSRVSRLLEDKKRPIAALLRTQAIFSGGVTLIALAATLIWPAAHVGMNGMTLAIVLFTGIVIHTLGSVFYTQGLLRSARPAILALWSLMPVLAVGWLWLFGAAHITPDIILGGIFILTAGLMTTVKADTSASYAASIMALLLGGLYVYFCRGRGMEDYYQAISVPLFFYAILVAFMMDRLIKSDELEERLAIEIINHIDAQAAKIGAGAKACRAHILGIVTTNNVADVNTHYRAARNGKDAPLAAVHDQLDQLVLSKVRGTNFSEMFVIFIIGALTIVSSMVYRPDSLIADGFAVVVPLSVVFIFFTVIDLARKRQEFNLTTGKDGAMTLSDNITRDLFGDHLIASLLIVVILSAFTGLFFVKHALR